MSKKKPEPSQKLKDKASTSFGFNKIKKDEVAPIMSTPNSVLSEIFKLLVKADVET